MPNDWGHPELPPEPEQLEALPTLEIGEALVGNLDEIRSVETKYGTRAIARFENAMVKRNGSKEIQQHPVAELWLPEFLTRLFRQPKYHNKRIRIVRVATPADRGRMQWFDVRLPKQQEKPTQKEKPTPDYVRPDDTLDREVPDDDVGCPRPYMSGPPSIPF